MTAGRAWSSERGVLWGIDLSDSPRTIAPRLAVRFGEVSPTNAQALAIAMGARELDLIRERLASGRQAFAAFVDDEVAAYCWVSRAPEYIGEQDREIKIAADEAYIWDCATLPPYRGQHLYSALLSHILSALRADGVRRVWIGTAVSNRASLRGFRNSGFVPLITLTFLRVGQARMWLSSEQRGAPPDLLRAARRVLGGDEDRSPPALRMQTGLRTR